MTAALRREPLTSWLGALRLFALAKVCRSPAVLWKAFTLGEHKYAVCHLNVVIDTGNQSRFRCVVSAFALSGGVSSHATAGASIFRRW